MVNYLFDLLPVFLSRFGNDLSPGRLVESVILLAIIWKKLGPHLKVIETRLGGIEDKFKGLESTMKTGFNQGEERFKNIEGRLNGLENKPKEGENGIIR